MTIFLLILGAVALWGVLATAFGLEGDGYGRREIRDRNRGPGQSTPSG